MLVKYQQWSMRRVLIDDLNHYQWRTVMLIVRTKVMLKNWRYLRKLMFTASKECTYISCSAGALCSGCGALMCNIQTSALVKTS
jgi:hypothetical protein